MGEDRTMCAEKKHSGEVSTSPCRHRHSSVISSCSEDAESESTSAGYPPSPDEEREEELEYGPGIVNKLRTRFLSITLKQNRGTNMRRSCSMENLLDQPLGGRPFKAPVGSDSAPVKQPWGNLKRAKSMDTLLMEMHPDDDHKAPKVVKGGLNRLVPIISDEELPKPDTVKTYKRMFEPAESRRGSHCRRPPVLRASARSSSGSKVNGVSPSPSAKVNGTSKSKFSAKQSPPVKAQSTDLVNGKKSPEFPKPVYNGCHVVKATPVKIHNGRNGKEIENLNSINRLLNKKEVHFATKTDIICNGNVNHKDILKIKSNEDIVKQFTKNTITNGNSMKPKVPPNRPSLRSPKPLLKPSEQNIRDVISPTKPKPILSNGVKKSYEMNNKSDLPKSPEPNLKDSSKIPREIPLINHIKSPPPERPKDEFVWPPESKSKDKAKNVSPTEDKAGVQIPPESDIKPEAIPAPEKKVKDIIQTLSESSTVKTEMQPQDKESIFKLTERTVPISPDLNNTDKSLKAPTVPPPPPPPKVPLMKPTTEPVRKPTSGFVDPVKKPTSGFVDSVKKPTCGFVEKSTSGFVDPLKKPTSGFVDPVKKPTCGFVEKSTSGFLDPAKKQPIHGSTPDKSPISPPEKKLVNGLPEPATKKSPVNNGFAESSSSSGKSSKLPTHDSPDISKRPAKKSQAEATSMVFDFRGKDVVPHVAVLPVPFGCKALHPKKRADVSEDDEEDEDYVDYSVPPPSGVVFEGENVKIGRGSILATRNKDLKITFDDDVDGNTFVYPSETSLIDEPDRSPPSTSTNEVIPNGQPPPPNSKLKTNTSIGSSSAGGLSTYTPSVLRTMDNFEPGMTIRPPPDKDPEAKGGEEVENTEVVRQGEAADLKPADPDLISSWSLSAGTSDLLF